MSSLRPCNTLVLWGLLASFAPSAALAAWAPSGTPVGSFSPEQIDPHVVSDGGSGAFVLWDEGFNSRAQHLTLDGEYAPGWPREGLVLPPGRGPEHYRIEQLAAVPDGEGGMYVACFDGDACTHSCGVDPGQLYLQRLTSSGDVSPGWSRDGVQVERPLLDSWSGPWNQTRVRLERDGRGGVLIVWFATFLSAASPPPPSLLAVQCIASDGVRRWGLDGIRVAQGGGLELTSALVADGEGGALVFWGFADAPSSAVALHGQHVSRQGKLLWGPGGVSISPSRLTALSGLAAVSDKQGGAIVAWAGTPESGGPGSGVFAARVTRRGILPWQHDVPLCTATGGKAGLRLAPGPDGGAIAAWLDSRGGANRQVYAQRVARAGRVEWGGDGVPVCTAPGDHTRLALVDDGGAGAYVAWGDTRPEGELFATRLSRQGRPGHGWPENGALISPWQSSDSYHVGVECLDLAATRGGRAVVTWTDLRPPPFVPTLQLDQSFAMLLQTDGPATSTETPSPGPPPAERQARSPVSPAAFEFALHGVHPNPASSGAVVDFVLPSAQPASLDVFDIVGRRVWWRDLGDLGPGDHQISLRDVTWSRPGLYIVRLTQGERRATARVVITR